MPREMLGPRLLDRGRANSLNLVRLVLAMLVLVSHSWQLSGSGDGPSLGGVAAATWGVFGFFVISGFLVSASRTRLGAVAFVRARALRILPGFWVCLVVVAFVVAPIAAVAAGEHWRIGSAATYVVQNLLLATGFGQPGIEDTLRQVPVTAVWNGSLWTLIFEAAAYVGLLVVLVPVVRRSIRAAAVGLFLAAVALHVVTLSGAPVAGGLAAYFAAGILLFAWGDVVPVRWPLSAVAVVMALSGPFLGPVGALTQPLGVAYVVLFAGAVIPPRAAQRHDISYGVYIYAFPFQQLLATVGLQRLGVVVFLLASAAGASALGWASWLLVERRAMRWKPVSSRRLRDERVRATLDQ